MKKLIIFLLLFLQVVPSISQSWVTVTNSPQASFRHDDFYFINPDTGWIVNQGGNVYRTHDGGNTWDTLVNNGPFYGRSIGFFDAMNGLMGQYGGTTPGNGVDSNALYVTHNGGDTWLQVLNYNGPVPAGICGISIVNNSVGYGVGRIDGDATFIKTIDGGNTFSSVDMMSYSAGLVDCHFFDPDTGIVVGKSAGSTYLTSVPVIWMTTNGGQTWQNVYTGVDSSRWCWKINFISRDTGFVSVENWSSIPSVITHFILKTTNGGLSWQKIPVVVNPVTSSRLQGIGFINNNIGYTGEGIIRKTIDGGQTWTRVLEMTNFNRYRSVNDTVKYAVGKKLYKFEFGTTSLPPEKDDAVISELSGAPNPVQDNFTISFLLHKSDEVLISVYNNAGIRVYKKELGYLSKLKNEHIIPMSEMSPGPYYIVVSIANESQTIQLIKL